MIFSGQMKIESNFSVNPNPKIIIHHDTLYLSLPIICGVFEILKVQLPTALQNPVSNQLPMTTPTHRSKSLQLASSIANSSCMVFSPVNPPPHFNALAKSLPENKTISHAKGGGGACTCSQRQDGARGRVKLEVIPEGVQSAQDPTHSAVSAPNKDPVFGKVTKHVKAARKKKKKIGRGWQDWPDLTQAKDRRLINQTPGKD